MKGMRFKVIAADDSVTLENRLNEWVGSLPEGSKVRRTQLASLFVHGTGRLYALVNYESPEGATTSDKTP